MFTLVNDKNAMKFDDLYYGRTVRKGYVQRRLFLTTQARRLHLLVQLLALLYRRKMFRNRCHCSVRPQCAKVDINSLVTYCDSNEFGEEHGHGVRKLVTNPALLSKIN